MLGAIINKAAMNILLQTTKSRIADQSGYTLLPTRYQYYSCSPSLPTFDDFRRFNFSHLNGQAFFCMCLLAIWELSLLKLSNIFLNFWLSCLFFMIEL